MRLTIVLPIKETEELRNYLLSLHSYLTQYPTIIIDEFNLSDARRYGIDKVDTEYTLCLDLDTILPEGYIERAIEILVNPDVAVVAIDYERLQGHLAFGTSVWKTDILRKLYDWKNIDCECIHMWKRVHSSGYLIETLPIRAKHIKHIGKEC